MLTIKMLSEKELEVNGREHIRIDDDLRAYISGGIFGQREQELHKDFSHYWLMVRAAVKLAHCERMEESEKDKKGEG